ncbi:GDSL-type esterase/lipase family protein [Corynebacterium anserum]|uniref:Uncharacterized protein n=1 Tax=Corynebacterium anserum TaxID=2684406 RepID=A0A7G7YLM2_9CORY|nr:GDSL-type esterase/lipase family protein [Corynebacterium anserum]MBC2681450.1 hypothetical protein [Corynebacterium anserum]QNH95392.1 hypothetical protein GP473_00580 [Corynebacterium anserum]
MTKQRASFKATLVAVATALATAVSLAPSAEAAPRNIVLFGDSMTANAYAGITEYVQGPGKVSPNVPAEGRCPRGAERIAPHLAWATGLPVDDFPCNGAVAYAPEAPEKLLSTQVDQAIGQRKLTPNTAKVVFQIGLNDTYKGLDLFETQQRRYLDAVGAQIDRVRAISPNARITLMGYPQLAGPNGEFCPVHFNGIESGALPVIPIRNMLNAVHAWMQETARVKRVSFQSLEAETAGHDTCAPADRRWVSGIVDNESTPYNMTNHLTHEGSRQVAYIMARKI